MTTFKIPLLRELPNELRWLTAMLMVTLGIGYLCALGYVYVTTGMVPLGVEERYIGTPIDSLVNSAPSERLMRTSGISERPANPQVSPRKAGVVTGEAQQGKNLVRMLNITHAHVLTMTFIFAFSGVMTFMTLSFSQRVRKWIVIEPFIGIVLTFAGLWLTRFIHPAFSWLVSISGIAMALAFGCQCWAIVKELRVRPSI